MTEDQSMEEFNTALDIEVARYCRMLDAVALTLDELVMPGMPISDPRLAFDFIGALRRRGYVVRAVPTFTEKTP